MNKKPILDYSLLNINPAIDYVSDDFAIINSGVKDIKNKTIAGFLPNGAGFAFCKRGTYKIISNGIFYEGMANDLLVIVPNSSVQILGVSDDFEVIIIAFSFDIINEFDLSVTVPFISSILEKPIFSIPNNYATELTKFFWFISQVFVNKNSIQNRDVTKHLVLALCYQINAICQQNVQETLEAKSRREEIYHKLMKLINENYKTQHKTQFYADKLSITPKYLSMIIKAVANKSVNDLINEALIISAKMQLKISTLSVQQISYDLNFSSPSFFGRFFRNHTGMTPLEFRRN